MSAGMLALTNKIVISSNSFMQYDLQFSTVDIQCAKEKRDKIFVCFLVDLYVRITYWKLEDHT